MAKRVGFGILPFVLLAGALSALSLIVRQSIGGAQSGLNAPACVGDLNRQTYTDGFQSSDFITTTAAAILPGAPPAGGIQLDTNLAPLNPERIVLPFDQDVRIKSVYFNAGATHTFGYFYIDQINGKNGAPYYFDEPTQTLVDANGNGVPDFHEALWQTSGGVAQSPLVRAATSYSDGGNYPHIPNLLEPYDAVINPTGFGHLIFQIQNDDRRTGWTFTYNGVNLPPIQDASGTVDGISDYDVNGDGIVGNEPDRTVDLGIIKGGREIVFYTIVYWGQTGKQQAFGQIGAGLQATGITPFFSKTVLNVDQGSVGANDTISYIDVGAPAVKSTGGQCENASPAATANGVPTPLGTFSRCSWTPYPTNVNNDATLQTQVYGWLDQPTLNRLNTPTYNNLLMANEVRRVKSYANGAAPHFFVGAPANDQNRWILGYEDLLGYTSTSCAGCTKSDFDWNDVVVIIERTNGGQVVSQNVAADIPAGQLANTMISRVRLRYSVTLPSPQCDGDATAGVQIYYSVNGGTSWRPVPMTNPLSGDVVVDVLANGDVGNKLQWKAVFTSSRQQCQPVLNHVDVGYEAIQHGEYKFSAPVPLSNLVYAGTVETPSSTWAVTRNDYSLRGHFYATKLFDPITLKSAPANTLPTWDAGAVLATRSPDARYVLTNNNGSAVSFTTANGATLYQQLLPAAVRGLLNNGNLVYDYNQDGVVDDVDAQFLLQWSRGWEYPPAINLAAMRPPAVQPQARAWMLGPVHDSSPALIGPPGNPGWLNGAGAGLSAYQSKFITFKSANAQRKTLAVVGAQSGLLEAFNAGSFRQSGDSQCAVNLARGCFATVGSSPDYGDGSEVWAYVPPSQLLQLKNNHPYTRNYLPAQNPNAEVDGSVSAEDIYLPSTGNFTTGIFASLGTNQPYITALRIDGDPKAPQPLWASDFSDFDFQGSNFSPGVVPFGQTPGGIKSLVIVSSGLAPSSSPAVKTFMFILDAATGVPIKNGSTTIGKVALDSIGTSLGIGGYPNIVDANNDGIYDRAYVVDTSGRIYKVDLTTPTFTACRIASVGESVFAGMATSVVGPGTTPKVRIFLGGSPNPDGSTNPPIGSQYHAFAFDDNDALGTCTTGGAQLVFTYNIQPPGKIWAAPFVTGTTPTGQVYFATSNGNSASICDVGGGTFVTLGFDASPTGAAQLPNGAPITLTGEAVSSIRVYDGHAIINTVGGHTDIVGSGGWNNTPGGSGSNTRFKLLSSSWFEY